MDVVGEPGTAGQPGDAGHASPRRPFLDSLPGLVRRARRRLDVSQRGLAELLGVSQSRVARWETGRTIPSAADLEDVLALAGIVLRAEDERGEPVPPMDGGVVRDRADRYFPAHADPRGDGWWSPREALRSAGGGDAWRRSRAEGVPRITYDLGIWRDVTRALRGTPPDHPTLDEVVAERRARDSQRRRAS